MTPARPGLLGFRISAISPARSWSALDAVWAAAGESDAFDAGWMSDHLADVSQAGSGPAFEAVAAAAALAHRVPGKWIGVAVFANTFRQPQLLAKSATVIDNATGGRFVLGIGAGWHVGEHHAFGIELPSPGERLDRLESAVQVLRALFSDSAKASPGVTLDDANYPLRGATMEPPPASRAGPPIWVGSQGPRGTRLAARYADGWPMPGNRPGDVDYFATRRDDLLRALEAAGRDPDEFTFAAQVECGVDRISLAEARALARRFVDAGADHLILALPADAGAAGVRVVASELAAALRDELAQRKDGPSAPPG